MTPNQTKALAALLTCKSRTDAARVCGLSTKTLQGYEKLPEFADALERGRREALAADTVDALQAIVRDDAAADPARVAAARALLDYGLKFAELTDINKRLDRLEGML